MRSIIFIALALFTCVLVNAQSVKTKNAYGNNVVYIDGNIICSIEDNCEEKK